MHDIGWMAIVATGCMASAVACALIKLLAIEGDQLEATSVLPPRSTRTIEALIAVLNLCFAFGGQVGEQAGRGRWQACDAAVLGMAVQSIDSRRSTPSNRCTLRPPGAHHLQVNWMRYLSGMAHREEFKYAAEVADSLMTLIYLLLGIVACE